MKNTLKKYKEANLFCLSERVDNLYISNEEYDEIIEKLKVETYNTLKETFNYCVETGAFKKTYDFDTLYNDILEECNLKKDRFIADKLLSGKTKYDNDGCIYFMYHEINDIYFKSLLKEKFATYEKDDYVIDDEVLRNNLNRVEIKYNNYATIGSLFRIYYFNLNEETYEWLLKKKDVLNFNYLDDFALLKDDQVLYTTCTHEGYK